MKKNVTSKRSKVQIAVLNKKIAQASKSKLGYGNFRERNLKECMNYQVSEKERILRKTVTYEYCEKPSQRFTYDRRHACHTRCQRKNR